MFRKSYALNLAVLSAVIFAVLSFFPAGPGKDGIPVADNRSPEPSSALSQGSGLVQVVVRRKHSGIYYLDGTPSPTFTSFLPGTALDRRIVVVERIAYPSLAEIFVLLPDRRRINAVVVWENLVAGLAVLKADEDLPSWISLAEETSLRGELVKVFLVGDAASCAKTNQKVPPGYYNVEVMLRSVGRHGGEIGACCVCMDARGISDTELSEAVHRSSLDQLTDWTQWADKILVF